jgi:hypothetical protein
LDRVAGALIASGVILEIIVRLASDDGSRDPSGSSHCRRIGQFAAIQSVAPSFGVELRPIDMREGLLIGPPSDAVDFLGRLFSGPFLSDDAASAMKSMHALGGSIAGRPWKKTGYGLGLMIGEMEKAGLAYGHSGVGHDSVSSLYCFPKLPDSPMVAVFAQGTNEGTSEFEALNLALG